MGMCSKCLDVTRWLYEARPTEGSNTTVYGEFKKTNQTIEYNLFLPADKPLSDDMPYLWTSVGGGILDNITTAASPAYAPHVFLNATTLDGWDWLMASGDLDESFRAAVSPEEAGSSIASQALFNDHCIIDDQPITLDNMSSLISPDRILNSTFVDGKNVSVPHECFYEFPGTYIRGIQDFLSRTLKGGCEMPSTQSLYNDGNATFDTIDANVEAITVAMTNELRRTGTAWDGTPLFVQGDSSRATVCMRFDWKWLSFPLALLVLTTMMLVILGVKTLFDKQQTPIWKSSALPLLFTGNGIGMKGAQDRVEREVDGTVVSLRKREDGGWEFVSQGDLSGRATASGYDGATASSAKARAVVRPVS
ncbi:hypothetical protein N0V91_003910 [Didymella pomorum]|uniref:Uncharacterized protein n=1 Tax=Didymella pomorum TaxID=749634 RepID=A0A9W9D829_9PLEO|nr:hypothetical protein N0V91_003910 [Didymella pomorum]